MSQAPLIDITSNQENTSHSQVADSSTANIPTPSPSTNDVAQFDHIRGCDIFGPGQFCSSCSHICRRFGIKCAELQFRDICLQTVIDYIEGEGGMKKRSDCMIGKLQIDVFQKV